MSDNNGGNVVPGKLNASDFTLINTTPEMTKMFQMMLDRVQAYDPVGTAVIQQQWLEGGRVVMNPLDGVVAGNQVSPDVQSVIEARAGTDMWDAGTHAIYWNPYSALQVTDGGGNPIGIQSSTVAFVHEAAHAIDPMSIVHMLDQPLAGYPNTGEYLAGQYETMSAINLGEVVRQDHGGKEVLVDNPNTRTVVIDGQVYWIKTAADGQMELGPKYDFKLIPRNWDAPGESPKFGSADPGHAADYNHPSPHDENGGPITNTGGGGGEGGAPNPGGWGGNTGPGGGATGDGWGGWGLDGDGPFSGGDDWGGNDNEPRKNGKLTIGDEQGESQSSVLDHSHVELVGVVAHQHVLV
jgi:hypothetical protein